MGIISATTHKQQIDCYYQLFLKIKTNIQYVKSKMYMNWFHERYPNRDPHHPFGSIGSLKTTDYFCVPLTRTEHQHVDAAGEAYWAIDNLDLALNTAIEYISFLENKIIESNLLEKRCQLNQN